MMSRESGFSMLFKTKQRTGSGLKFSIMGYDNVFDPHEIRIHAELPRSEDGGKDNRAFLDALHGIEATLQSQLPQPFGHDIVLKIYSQAEKEAHIKGRGQTYGRLKGMKGIFNA